MQLRLKATLRAPLAFGLMFAALLAEQEERLTFEVASIKPTRPQVRGSGVHVMPGGQGWVAQGVPLRFIIGYMYWVPTSQVTGGPAWLDEFWDIVGKTDHPRQLEDLRERCSAICWRMSSS
jgi:uncharacterized protein (TIGR03435 family)